ncbi:MAG: helicase-associated domain-containing protein [Actinomycetota bacterium]
MTPPGPVRSLADELREWPDSRLAGLLRDRPDLISPAPPDIATLAARSTTRASVYRALDLLDNGLLTVATLAAHNPGISRRELQQLSTAGANLDTALSRLRDLALIWGTDNDLHIIGTARDILDVHPATEPNLTPPDLIGPTLTDEEITAHAGPSAAAGLEWTELLGELWGANPPAILRRPGLGTRDLRRTAAALDATEEDAARVIELAHDAGLIAADHEHEPYWAPTPDYDEWRSKTPAQQWSTLACAWWVSDRMPSLAGSRDDNGTIRTALSASLTRPQLPSVRADVCAELADSPHQVAPTFESMLSRLRWRHPRRAATPGYEAAVTEVLTSARWLGITGAEALTAAGRVLVADALTGHPDHQRTAIVAAELFPSPIHEVVVQADLTVIVPGPPSPEMRTFLRLIAEVESRGAATVYRCSPRSVRPALDAGWSGGQILSHLRNLSRTPLPQALEYLIQDEARRHGAIRVGSATCYIRTHDEASAGRIIADPRNEKLRCRAIAPTVLVSQAPPRTVLAVLDEMGITPTLESPDGEVLSRTPLTHRAPGNKPKPAAKNPRNETISEVVQRLRNTAGPLDDPEPVVAVSAITEAIRERQGVYLTYVDHRGQRRHSWISPIRVDAGQLLFRDDGSVHVSSIPLHRIQVASINPIPLSE